MSTLSFSTIFPSSEAVKKEIDTLSRLSEVSKNLGRRPDVRAEGREKLKELSEYLIQMVSLLGPNAYLSSESLKRRISEKLLFLYFGSPIDDIGLDKVTEVAQTILQDTVSLGVIPIKSSRLGQHGPTFLVDYPRKTEGSQSLSYCSYVMKNVDPLEVVCNRIYFEFANCISCARDDRAAFFVPQTSLIDLTQQRYFSFSGECSGILEIDSLRQSLGRIAAAMKKSDCFSEKVMLAEKIQGQNILDFVSSAEYSEASEGRKKSFFLNLGGLSLLDLLMGNLERFFAVDLTVENLLCLDLAANLGNALVVPEEDENAFLYAIDNGISPHLCLGAESRIEWSNADFRLRYNKLMQHIISSPEGLESFVSNIVNALKIWEELDEDKTLGPFLKDLTDSELCVDRVREGILQMGSYIKKYILPFWEGRESDSLKDFIRSNCDALLEPLDERVKVFKSSYSFS
jgi:hypothetical protein